MQVEEKETTQAEENVAEDPPSTETPQEVGVAEGVTNALIEHFDAQDQQPSKFKVVGVDEDHLVIETVTTAAGSSKATNYKPESAYIIKQWDSLSSKVRIVK